MRYYAVRFMWMRLGLPRVRACRKCVDGAKRRPPPSAPCTPDGRTVASAHAVHTLAGELGVAYATRGRVFVGERKRRTREERGRTKMCSQKGRKSKRVQAATWRRIDRGRAVHRFHRIIDLHCEIYRCGTAALRLRLLQLNTAQIQNLRIRPSTPPQIERGRISR